MPRRAAEELPGDFAPCVSNFYSPLQRRVLPQAVTHHLRAEGLNLPGTVATGFLHDAFPFADPNSSPSFGIIVDDATWGKGAKLRVCFLDGSSRSKEQVETFAKLWSEPADVKFTFGATRTQSDIRITFRQAGFYSRLGMEANHFPQETMSLGFRGNEQEEEVRRLVLHEFGHAIGFMHEHQHPESGIEWDEQGAIAVYKPLLPPEMSNEAIMEQLRAIPRNSFRYKVYTFDPKSIMMYSIPERAVKRGTYKPEFGNNNTNLADSDKQIAAEVYGPGPKPPDGNGEGKKPPKPVAIKVDGPPVAASITRDGEVGEFYFKAPTDGRYTLTVKGDALVHVDLTDTDGEPPFSRDRGEDSDSPRLGLTMMRSLDAGKWNVRVTASRFATFSRGTYTITVEQTSS
jgi:hypothetical protein